MAASEGNRALRVFEIHYVEVEHEFLVELRNYFGEHDKTMFEHKAFAVLDKLLKVEHSESNEVDLFTRKEMVDCFESGAKFARDMFNNPSNSEYINKIIKDKN